MALSNSIVLTVVLAPLMGCLLAGFFGKKLGRTGTHRVTILGLLVSSGLSLYILYQLGFASVPVYNHNLYTWFEVGRLHASIGFLVDRLTALMMVVVTFVSLLVHIYTIGYMADDPGYQRFFSYISLFTFAMLMLVMANNFLQLFFGWEAVGLVSYLLIGFWYRKSSAIFANLKAFLVNRVGDFGFLLGIAAVFYFMGTLDYASVFAHATLLTEQVLVITQNIHWDGSTVICVLLFVGAMAKSAQVPLHVWLPDSMEGPTPISALIHAATMVTAGIFMVARMSPLFELSPPALSLMLVTGGTGALFTGLMGVVQNDIKRVIAYSTLSQLGYMTAALGVSMYTGAVFHLMTHAFFKALLFLGAGSVIITMHHEQDMRYMGGLRKYMPITWLTMWTGSLALCAVPFFSGFYSKDMIIEVVGESHGWGSGYAWFCVVAGTFVTALYTFRLMYLTFHGKARFRVATDHSGEPHYQHHEPGVLAHAPKESSWVVTLPLVLLAIPSVLVGFFTIRPLLFGHWLDQAIYVTKADSILTMMSERFHGGMAMALHGFLTLPFALVLLAFVITTYIYLFNPTLADRLKQWFKPIWIVLDRKFWFDPVYDVLFARGSQKLGLAFWKVGDAAIVDGVLVNGSVQMVNRMAAMMRRLQSGYLYHYVFAMMIGLILLLGGYWLTGS